jgi:hypothetical protein
MRADDIDQRRGTRAAPVDGVTAADRQNHGSVARPGGEEVAADALPDDERRPLAVLGASPSTAAGTTNTGTQPDGQPFDRPGARAQVTRARYRPRRDVPTHGRI